MARALNRTPDVLVRFCGPNHPHQFTDGELAHYDAAQFIVFINKALYDEVPEYMRRLAWGLREGSLTIEASPPPSPVAPMYSEDYASLGAQPALDAALDIWLTNG